MKTSCRAGDDARTADVARKFVALANPCAVSAAYDRVARTKGQLNHVFADVQLRGLPSLRLQGENIAQTEIELRWQRWGRYSLVVVAGGGAVWKGLDDYDNEKSTATGGIGMRYLAARLFGLHMGLDVGFEPDDPIFCIQFGSAWLRP